MSPNRLEPRSHKICRAIICLIGWFPGPFLTALLVWWPDLNFEHLTKAFSLFLSGRRLEQGDMFVSYQSYLPRWTEKEMLLTIVMPSVISIFFSVSTYLTFKGLRTTVLFVLAGNFIALMSVPLLRWVLILIALLRGGCPFCD